MKRKDFIRSSAGAGFALASESVLPSFSMRDAEAQVYPCAIAMWDFSWLERRWPGAGYEDWDQALLELKERGYNAIRIDAYPHLVYKDAAREYLLKPFWETQDWGSPAINRVRVQPYLTDFIRCCAKHCIKVGLSSWWREDEAQSYKAIIDPEKLAAVWLSVLDIIKEQHLLNHIFYVDISNEWPTAVWTPYKTDMGNWDTKESIRWMKETTSILREHYPAIPYTFSFTGEVTKKYIQAGDLSMLDLIDTHIWMANAYDGGFNKTIGYDYQRYSYEGYDSLALKGEQLYKEKKNYWQDGLLRQIENAADWSKTWNLPLLTTECWGVIDYKDWPLLCWDWVKELCELGTREALKTGRWAAVATSNFCGPQFVGMWRDVQWHTALTKRIKTASLDKKLRSSGFVRRSNK